MSPLNFILYTGSLGRKEIPQKKGLREWR